MIQSCATEYEMTFSLASRFMPALLHNYPFDPSYGYGREQLLMVGAPEEPPDYEAFWRARHEKALAVDTMPALTQAEPAKMGWHSHDFSYLSTDGVRIGGWILLPENGVVERVIVVMHGYGGRTEPDFHWRFENAALVFLVLAERAGVRILLFPQIRCGTYCTTSRTATAIFTAAAWMTFGWR